LVLYSGIIGESVEEEFPTWSSCTGVWSWFVFASGGRRRYEDLVSRMQRRLAVVWMAAGWSKLDLPSTVAVTYGEFWARVRGTQGAAPVDELSTVPPSHPCG
jgi:hypothetical protein